MIDISLDFSGLEAISRDLELLSRAENNKVLRDATRAGAEVLKDEVIVRAPERTGKLKKNVVVLTQRSRKRGDISSGVHIRGRNMRTGKVDVYSLTLKEARNLCEMALQVVKPLNPTNISKTPGYEPENRYYRATLEFQVTV
ncbi:hypothetical protein AIR78_08330 [Salmonella enterica]|nr:hypothetical protein [Salmonella enterica]EAU0119043.1 hypothetical protein [Salmonella enterica]EBA3391701.1 hypothetical protein [Salmonella enterica]